MNHTAHLIKAYVIAFKSDEDTPQTLKKKYRQAKKTYKTIPWNYRFSIKQNFRRELETINKLLKGRPL